MSEPIAPSGLTETFGIIRPAIPSIGRIVHYVLAPDEIRPAIVVRKFRNMDDPLMVNMLVFVDGYNDRALLHGHEQESAASPMVIWRTSVHYDANQAVSTWHWPPYV